MVDITDNKTIFFFSIIAVLFYSCNNPQAHDLISIDIPPQTDEKATLSLVADSIYVINLETNHENLISRVSDVHLFGSSIYVVDGSGKIFAFDKSGKHLGQIGRKGDGPGEYRYLQAITHEIPSGNLTLASPGKLIVFSANHELLNEKKIHKNFDNLEWIDGSLYFVSQIYDKEVPGGFSNESILYKLNDEFEITDSLILRQTYLQKRSASTLGYRHYWSGYDSRRFLYIPIPTNEPFLRDTLFEYKERSLIPVAKLNFPIPHHDDKGNKLYWICNIVNTPTYITSHYYRSGGEISMLIFDKNNQRAINVEEGILDEEGDRVLLRPLDTYSNLFYYVKPSKFKTKEVEELNPVIGIIKLK